MSRSTLTFFLLVASFGILLAGCSSGTPPAPVDEFTFTDNDLAKVHELAGQTSSSDSAAVVVTSSQPSVDTLVASSAAPSEDLTIPTLQVSSAALSSSSAAVPSTPTVLTESVAPPSIPVDAAKKNLYDAIRMAIQDQSGNVYRVNNPFLNVRAAMDVTSALVEKINQGDVVTVLDIPNAGWAKVKLQSGKEGYVAMRYIAKLTTEEKLPAEKKLFEGKYYVNFAFLNIRKEPSTQAEKIGELPGQAIVTPLSMNKEWAKVAYAGKEGYVSAQYLEPFQPVFLVRQDSYVLPILQYSADDSASIQSLAKQIASLKTAGKKIVTLRALMTVVLAQETKDSRISPDTVALTVTGVNAKNLKSVSDALQSAAVDATFFIQTKDLGISGITEKTLLTLMANGNDIQSGGHTGDDLRSMTDSQVALELGQSKKLIQDITKKEVYVVAYPKGGVNDRVMSAASGVAYLFGLGESPDKQFTRSQFLRLPSFRVTAGMTPEDVLKLVK